MCVCVCVSRISERPTRPAWAVSKYMCVRACMCMCACMCVHCDCVHACVSVRMCICVYSYLASPLCHGHLVFCSSVTPSLHHSRLSCQRGGHHNPPRIRFILSQPQYRSLIITQRCLSYLNCSLLAFAPDTWRPSVHRSSLSDGQRENTASPSVFIAIARDIRRRQNTGYYYPHK